MLIFKFDRGKIKPDQALRRLNKNYIFDIIILFVLPYYLLYRYYIHAKSKSTQNLCHNILTKMLIGICFCPFEQCTHSMVSTFLSSNTFCFILMLTNFGLFCKFYSMNVLCHNLFNFYFIQQLKKLYSYFKLSTGQCEILVTL